MKLVKSYKKGKNEKQGKEGQFCLSRKTAMNLTMILGLVVSHDITWIYTWVGNIHQQTLIHKHT